MSQIQRSFEHAVTGIWRDRHWKLTLLALSGSCLLIQLLVLFWLVAFGAKTALVSQAPVRLEFIAEATSQDIADFRAAVAELPEVREAVYIPKEKLYEQMQQEDPELLRTVEELGLGNPFPDAIRITPRSFAAYNEISALLTDARWQSLIDPAAHTHITQVESMAAQLQGGVSAGGALSTVFIELTIGILLITIVALVALRFRQRAPEITVQYLLGAHTFGIAGPLLGEAILLLLIAILGSAVLTVGILFAAPAIAPLLGIEAVVSPIRTQLAVVAAEWLPTLVLTEIAAMFLLALMSTIFALTGKQQIRPALL